jgi:thioredoxin-like negative regulator of GroEL
LLTTAGRAATFDLNWDRLTDSLKLSSLSVPDREILDQSIGFIKNGDHNLAILRLKELVQANNTNGGIRLLLAYALLNAGNQFGAFDEAKRAEKVAHDGYVCLFLAKVAFVVGDHTACKRELKHVDAMGGDPTGEAAALAKELEEAKRRPRKRT